MILIFYKENKNFHEHVHFFIGQKIKINFKYLNKEIYLVYIIIIT